MNDPALVTLTLQQFGSSTIRKHLNKTSVTREAIDDLNSAGPTSEAVSDIDDDWLNKFEHLAADASSERMRKLLGKVLSGEIRRPGAYSFATLNFINLMDASVGKSIEALAPYVVNNDYIPFMDRFDFTVNFEHYMALKDYGLIGDSIKRKFDSSIAGGNVLLKHCDYAVVMAGLPVPEIPINLMPLTRVGKEIFPLINVSVTIEQVRQTADLCLAHTTCSSVLIASISKQANGDERLTPIENKTREQE